MILKIPVTVGDIAKGKKAWKVPGACRTAICPIAQAIIRSLKATAVEVNGLGTATIDGVKFQQAPNTISWMNRFDYGNRLKAKPFTAVLTQIA